MRTTCFFGRALFTPAFFALASIVLVGAALYWATYTSIPDDGLVSKRGVPTEESEPRRLARDVLSTGGIVPVTSAQDVRGKTLKALLGQRTSAGDAGPLAEEKRRARHAKVNSGYGTKVEVADADDDGERGGPMSTGRGAPTGKLIWADEEPGEEAPKEEACRLNITVIADGTGGTEVAVAGVLVHVRRQEKYTTVTAALAYTDDRGRLEVTGLPISWYRVSLEDDEALPHTRAFRCDGGENKDLVLKKRTGDSRIFGRVLEEGTNEPLAGAEVTLQEITREKEDFRVATYLTVNDEGGFDAVVRGGKAWQYRLYATVPGYEFTNADVFLKVGEQKRITFHLKPIGRVEGQVLTAAGAPAAGAKVTQGGLASLVGTVADDEGRFSMPLRPNVPVSLGGHLGGEFGVLRVRPPLKEGETRAGLVLQLRAGRTVRGLVLQRDGAPFPYAEVFVSSSGPSGGGWLRVVQADGDGRFEARGAPSVGLWSFAHLPGVRETRSPRVPIGSCPPESGGCATAPVDIVLEMPGASSP